MRMILPWMPCWNSGGDRQEDRDMLNEGARPTEKMSGQLPDSAHVGG